MKTKSVVLKEFIQLMALNKSKNTINNYCYYVSDFLDFSDNVPERVTNEDFLNYNIHLVKIGVSDSTRNVAINAVKLFFSLYLKKKVKQLPRNPSKAQQNVREILMKTQN